MTVRPAEPHLVDGRSRCNRQHPHRDHLDHRFHCALKGWSVNYCWSNLNTKLKMLIQNSSAHLKQITCSLFPGFNSFWFIYWFKAIAFSTKRKDFLWMSETATLIVLHSVFFEWMNEWKLFVIAPWGNCQRKKIPSFTLLFYLLKQFKVVPDQLYWLALLNCFYYVLQ